MLKKVSVSELALFDRCRRAWYLKKVLKIKRSTFLPLIIGGAVHDFIAYRLHRKTSSQREFFYKTLESTLKAFTRYWLVDVWPKYESQFNENLKWWALNEAKRCIVNYWNTARGKGVPIHIEKRYSIPVPDTGCTFVGVIDQIRPTSTQWAEQNGLDSPGHVLIDLKTGKPKFWSESEHATSQDQERIQTSLLNDIQPTMYYFLDEKVSGRYPDIFVYWFLGGDNPRIVTTTRDETDIGGLFDAIKVFLQGINGMSVNDYPKTPNTYGCGFCEFWESCWQDRERPEVAIPFDVADTYRPTGNHELPIVNTNSPKQLRMRFPKS